MADHWESALERWRSAGLIDADAVRDIVAWEAEHGSRMRHGRLAVIAFGFGGLLLMAGVLLFVAAHWEEISPLRRFLLVLSMGAVPHLCGAAAALKMPTLATTLHAVGTAALGAGIALAGQIFNMAEHWPGALLLWSLGAAAGLWLLQDWPHVLWLALLVPAWLWGEWAEAQSGWSHWLNVAPATGLTLLAFVYLFARQVPVGPTWRAALARLGAVTLLPAALMLGLSESQASLTRALDLTVPPPDPGVRAIAWMVALMLPTALAVLLRGRTALLLMPLAILWAFALGRIEDGAHHELALYIVYAIGAVGVVLWGVKDEQRLAINVGIFGFGLTIAFFYFSSLFDKLGRSLGLIGMGVLFIGGGWLLERTRRRLLGSIGGGVPA